MASNFTKAFLIIVALLFVVSFLLFDVGNPPPSCCSTGSSAASTPAFVSSHLLTSAWPNTTKPTCDFVPLRPFPAENPAGCPEEEVYVSRWAKLRSPSHHWIIVDVGANKGYTISGLLESLGLDQGGKFGKIALAKAVFAAAEKTSVRKEDRRFLCGGCAECGDDPMNVPANKQATWDIYAFDGTRSHVDFLRSFFAPLGNFSVKHAAVGAVPGQVHFPDTPLGYEAFGIGHHSPFPNVPVDVVTLNRELAHLPYIDVLLTDTEGHDYFVADGANTFIDTGRVGLYIFELHGRDRLIRTHIQRLSVAGYECFWPLRLPYATDRLLVPISNNCWNETNNEFWGWRNIVCANKRRPELLEVFKELFQGVSASKAYPDATKSINEFGAKHNVDTAWLLGNK